MADRGLLKTFWSCGDNEIIEFAIMRARLNKLEKEIICLSLDECKSQEQIAECLDMSTRNIQKHWRAAADKILSIPWVVAYAKELNKK